MGSLLGTAVKLRSRSEAPEVARVPGGAAIGWWRGSQSRTGYRSDRLEDALPEEMAPWVAGSVTERLGGSSSDGTCPACHGSGQILTGPDLAGEEWWESCDLCVRNKEEEIER